MSHDLTFVAPERRAEVRRRIAAVEGFIAAPGRRAAETTAAELGLSTAQFYNLVRAWRAKRGPEAMMGRHGSRNLPPRTDRSVLALIDEVIGEDSRAAPSFVIKRVASMAMERGITLPDPSTVARHVRRKRPSLLTHQQRSGLDLIIDHTVVDLPVDFGDGRARRPLATLIVDVASETPVGLAISRGTPGPAPSAAAMLDALRRGIRHSPARSDMPRIGIVAVSEAEGTAVVDAVRRVGFDAGCLQTHAHGGGLVAESLLGRQSAGLRLKQRLVWHEGARRVATVPPGSKALMPTEAEELIRGRLIDGHRTTMFAGLDDASRSRLAKALTEIAQAD